MYVEVNKNFEKTATTLANYACLGVGRSCSDAEPTVMFLQSALRDASLQKRESHCPSLNKQPETKQSKTF